MGKKAIERRKHQRLNVADCRARIMAKNASFNASVIDLSEGGARMKTEAVPPRLEELRIAITCENGMELYKAGVVVWFVKDSAPNQGSLVGIKFLKNLDPKDFDSD